jgi:hypothetical protein
MRLRLDAIQLWLDAMLLRLDASRSRPVTMPWLLSSLGRAVSEHEGLEHSSAALCYRWGQ